MAEAVGVVASIVQLVSATAKLVQYCADVAHAPAEADELVVECSALTPLLLRLKRDAKLQNSQAARPLLEPLADLKKRIDGLAERLRPESRLRRLSRDVLWPLLKKEMREVLERATQLNGFITSWMTLDVKDVAEAIKQDTAVLPDIVKTVQKTLSMTVQSEKRQTREMLNTMVNFFAPVSFSEKQNEIFGQRQPGTGQWFIDSPAFKEWLAAPGATLWCPGAPGSGKTFIASIVVDYLQVFVKKERGDIGLTYVYCDFRRRNQEPTTLLANIWTQLILQRDLSKTEVAQLEDDLYARRVKLSAAQLNALVEREFTDGKFQRMFVVIDALDECNEAQREVLLDHVSRLYPWANVLITSRVMGSDLERFTDVRILRIISAEADMHAYIKTRITDSRKLAENVKRRRDLEGEIVRIVSERAQGLFLLCKLHMDSLALESTPKAVRKVLEGIPTGDNAMRDTYSNAVLRIESQHPSNREWALRTIQWVCFAMRPLTATELTHALAVDQEDTELSEDNIVSTDLLVEYCGGLVVIEPESTIVRFVHFTTQEYFEAEKDNTSLFAGTDGSIALTCLTFLGFDDPFLNDAATLPEIREVHNATPFLQYAAAYFGLHYHRMLSHSDSADPSLAEDISDAMARFFKSPVRVHRAAVSALHTGLRRWQVWPGGHHPVGNLNVSAIDLGAFYDILLPADSDADNTSGSEDTPLTIPWFKKHTAGIQGADRQSFGNALHWAALSDSVKSMDLLFQEGSLDLDAQESNTWAVQPAHVAAVFGSVGTLRTLLEHSELNVTSRVGDNLNWTGTILHLAIRGVGSSSVATKLALIDVIAAKDVSGELASGYDIYGANALVVALRESEPAVFGRVLRWFDAVAGDGIWVGATRVMADRFAKTPLHWAVMDPAFGFRNRTVAADSGPLLKLRALLDHPLAWQLMWMRDNKGDVPFQEAVRQSNIHAVQYMIDKAIERQWPMLDQLLMSALYLAVEVAHWTVVELLLSKVGPELLARPGQETTVLHHAASGTSRGAMKFLLKKPEMVGLHNVRDRQRMTPLHIAAFTGNIDALEALLDVDGIEVDARDSDEDTPLHLAALSDIGDACSKLLVAGSDRSLKNARGLTPLAVALDRRCSSAARTILATNPQVGEESDVLDETMRQWLRDQSWGKQILLTEDNKIASSSHGDLHYWPQSDQDILKAVLCLRTKFSSAASRLTAVHKNNNTTTKTTTNSRSNTFQRQKQVQNDLSTYILDLAQYWTRTTSTRVGIGEKQMLRQWHHPTLPFLISAPVRGRIANPARRVEFTIVSHDQGYSDNPGAGSWTWFVAEAAAGSSFGENNNVTSSSNSGNSGSGSMTYGTQGGPIEICRNQIAVGQWCTHKVIWQAWVLGGGGGGGGGEADGAEATWVRSLRPENVVLVKPMVMFPGWENWVRRVTVDVYTSSLKYSGDDGNV